MDGRGHGAARVVRRRGRGARDGRRRGRQRQPAGLAGVRPDALLLGSHLDSVPDGGAFDGPLGVVSSFAARARPALAEASPERPIVVANFADEEGARFGIACAGSQLATGVLAPEKALALKDRDGLTLAEALTQRGRDPRAVGRADWLDDVGTFVELHVEQGRHLVHTDDAVGVATAIWPHGRWRLDFCGVADHAGATRMADRRDPMLAYAATVLAARRLATDADARATFGRLEVAPGGTNAIPSRVRAWLDARAATEDELERLVDGIVAEARQAATADATEVELIDESVSPAVTLRRPAARPARHAARRAGAADRRRSRRRRAEPARPHRDALRPQPHRRLALAGRARRGRRLRGRC